MTADFLGRLSLVLLGAVLTGLIGFGVQLRLAAEKRRIDREERHAKHLEDAVADLILRAQEAMDERFTGNAIEQERAYWIARRRLSASMSTTEAWAIRSDEHGFAQALSHLQHPIRTARENHLRPLEHENQLTWFAALQLLNRVCSTWLRDPDAYEPAGRRLSVGSRKSNGFAVYRELEKPFIEREKEDQARTEKARRAAAADPLPPPADEK